ncbi:MAG: HlyD family efflux transporter periplasmic adaptor subunit [Pseudomonadota bacterium]
MTRQIIWSVGLIGGALLLGALMIALRPAPEEVERTEEAPLVETVALEASSGPIMVAGSGTVQARDEVTVSVEVAGRLTYVNPAFREGGVVAPGAVLLRIDQSDYRNDVRIAQADVAAQRVAVLQAEEEVSIAREELERFSALEEARGAKPGDVSILPPRDLDRAEKGAVSAQTKEKSKSRTLATREPQLRSARAARERAAAGLADAQLLLSRTRVTAPFRGLVRGEDAAVGSLVQPGQALGSIVATGAYEVRLSLTPEESALVPGLLKPGGGRISASVTSEYGGKTYRWPAFVDRANSIVDSETRNIEVFVQVPAPLSAGRLAGDGTEGAAPPLLLGAFVEVEITGASLEDYATVPALAVRPGNQIWVVRDGKLAILPVRVIQRTDELAYITTPSLAEGGRVVVSNLNAPIDGMAVRVAKGKRDAASE